VALLIGTTAHAQNEPTAPAPDAPARVGRISLLSGPVTLTDFAADEESDASLNWPLTSQQRLTTGRLGRAEVRIGSTSLRLDGDSVLDFNRIDDEVIQVTLQHGSAALRVKNREQLREIDFLTPRERVILEDVGRYRIDVDRTAGVSAITVNVGSARVVSGRTNFVVQSGQRGEATAEPIAGFQLVTPAPDVFDDWVATRDRRDDSLQSTRYVSPETTGVESLDDHGEWRTVDSYGAVWFPAGVATGWAPYRYGHWAYVRPWGWTWIDDASWGFTPFHYGRWVNVHNVWGWVPGAYVARPCYAPALVAWYGTPGVSVSVGIGGAVGWFPLGPGEVFFPGYRYSRRYINSVNYGHVTNITNITVINPPPNYRYRQPNFSTWAPGDALVRRTPINRVVQSAPNEWAKLPTVQHPPVKVTEDARRTKQGLVRAVAPAESPRGTVPPRDVGRRPDEPARGDAPGRTPPGRSRPNERDAREDAPGRPPQTKVTPPDDHVAAPVQRAPRVEAPRPEAPGQQAPRGEISAPPRQKIQPVERPPAPPTGQVGAPVQQVAPRPAPAPRQEAPVQRVAPRPAPVPRQEAPVQNVAPRPVPAPRQEAPVHKTAPAREPSAENAPRPKVPQRQVETQRN
jgi:hypothetical protein